MTQPIIKASFLSIALILSTAGATLLSNPERFWEGILCLILGVGVICLREKLKKKE